MGYALTVAYSPQDYLTTRIWSGLLDRPYEISLTVEPNIGGSVSGGGMYYRWGNASLRRFRTRVLSLPDGRGY